VFGRHFSGEDTGMWTVDRDGSDLRQILDRDANPSDWSPGGSIVFSTIWPEAPGLPDVPSENPLHVSDSDVFTVRDDGTGVTRIVNSPIEDDLPRFAPGGRIEFLRHMYGYFERYDECRCADPRSGTYSVALDGGDERRLSMGLPSAVSYSPDGRWAAYGWYGHLYVMRADGSERTDRTPPGDFAGVDNRAVWGTDQDAGGPVLFFGGSPRDRKTANRAWTIYRLDVGKPDAAAVPLASGDWGGGGGLDWTPDPNDPPTHFVDRTAPAAFLVSAPDKSATASRVRVLSRRSLGLVAADATGIRRVSLAVARTVRRRGRDLCRFAGPDGLGRARRCDRPRFIRGASEEALAAPLRRLRRGAYVAGFTTIDVRGNRTRKLRLRPVQLR
jgi:hypothetical protein